LAGRRLNELNDVFCRLQPVMEFIAGKLPKTDDDPDGEIHDLNAFTNLDPFPYDKYSKLADLLKLLSNKFEGQDGLLDGIETSLERILKFSQFQMFPVFGLKVTKGTPKTSTISTIPSCVI
jgi:hypothetical protein